MFYSIALGVFLLGAAFWFIYTRRDTGGDAPYIPSEAKVVEKILETAELTKGETLYDLGSGDGRIIIAAAHQGAVGIGVETDFLKVLYSRLLIRIFGLNNSAKIIRKNFNDIDLSKADVVTLFLLQETNQKLKKKLKKELKKGARVVSYSFTFEDWEADKVAHFKDSNFGSVYLYKT